MCGCKATAVWTWWLNLWTSLAPSSLFFSVLLFLLEELPLCIKSSIQCSDHHSISDRAHTQILCGGFGVWLCFLFLWELWCCVFMDQSQVAAHERSLKECTVAAGAWLQPALIGGQLLLLPWRHLIDRACWIALNCKTVFIVQTAAMQWYSYVSDCLLRNMKGVQEGKMLFLLQNKPFFSLLWKIAHRNAIPAATWFFSIDLCKLCKFVRVWVWGITPERSDSRSFSGHNRVFYKWSSSNACITTDREEIAIFSSTVQHTHTSENPITPESTGNAQTNHKKFILSVGKEDLATCLLAIVNRSFSLSTVHLSFCPWSLIPSFSLSSLSLLLLYFVSLSHSFLEACNLITSSAVRGGIEKWLL